MSLRDDLRGLLVEARSIAGDAGFGLHPYRVYLRTTSSGGSHTGDGALAEVEVELTENGSPPKVKSPGGERSANGDSVLSDDAADSDIWVIGPLTQVDGTDWATLTADGVADGETWHLRVTHSESGSSHLCRVLDVDETSALHVMVTAVTVRKA